IKDRDVVTEAMKLTGDGTILRRLLRLDFHTLLPALLHVEDRTSMIENLESRPPLLDIGIVEYLARVPSAFLLKNGLKSLLRDAA
ncbi:asparagine synthase-related protein, partial [Bacillus sp. SIMBA_026]|uniref:asparagine synthase-related protein n=1 Tax=Bacillus sp. SIMBA_026 TaxID=3085769 RepID=UPI00397C41ED